MPTLDELIEATRKIAMTPEQAEEQRRSFAYGNTAIENALITREMIDEAAERLAGAGQSPRTGNGT
jgi:RNA-splicing ligase RtcB